MVYIMRINKPKWIVVHHQAGNSDFESVNKDHRNNPKVWLGKYSSLGFAIGYHYYITKLGQIHQGRADTDEGAHCRGMNLSSIGICLQGNFSVYGEFPTEIQKKTLKGLLKELMEKYDIPASHIVPHRHFGKTECYGLNLKNDWAQQLVAVELQKSDDKKDIELLKKQITIIEKMIRVYVKLLALLKFGKADN